MKIAIVHDWIFTLGGAERVLRELCKIYRDADLYTLFCSDKSRLKLGLNDRNIKTSFLQNIPLINKTYRFFLPIMPLAIESFDLNDYDLIISSSHCVAKGVLTNYKQIHVAYVHTPMRYAWDMYYVYLRNEGLHKGLIKIIAAQIFKKIRLWDLASSSRPDYYIANSQNVQKRIKKIYGKDSVVIYPPVDVNFFKPSDKKEDFYITAGRLVHYKRVDIILEAFSKLKDRKLIIAGNGPELRKLKKMATNNVEFLPLIDDFNLSEYLARAKAFIFAAEEDFGIMTVEAQACGTPVIAYKQGGATETVIDNVTGVFFNEQNPKAVVEAIERFERIEDKFSPQKIRKNAEKFSVERFREQFQTFISTVINKLF